MAMKEYAPLLETSKQETNHPKDQSYIQDTHLRRDSYPFAEIQSA